jgi:hypothetical protein
MTFDFLQEHKFLGYLLEGPSDCTLFANFSSTRKITRIIATHKIMRIR